MSLAEIKNNLQILREKVSNACAEAGRDPGEVTLLPVTKKQPLEKLQFLYDLGEKSFGENRVQELNEKAEVLPDDIQWHLIGSLQSNKARAALRNAACIHSVDSLKLIERLDRISGEENLLADFFLQINLTDESQKGGFAEVDLDQALAEAASCKHIRLKGFMAMGATGASKEETRTVFSRLRQLRDRYVKEYPQVTELSMGMSGDFELAILEGATYIRVGSLLLGARQY